MKTLTELNKEITSLYKRVIHLKRGKKNLTPCELNKAIKKTYSSILVKRILYKHIEQLQKAKRLILLLNSKGFKVKESFVFSENLFTFKFIDSGKVINEVKELMEQQGFKSVCYSEHEDTDRLTETHLKAFIYA